MNATCTIINFGCYQFSIKNLKFLKNASGIYCSRKMMNHCFAPARLERSHLNSLSNRFFLVTLKYNYANRNFIKIIPKGKDPRFSNLVCFIVLLSSFEKSGHVLELLLISLKPCVAVSFN